MAKLQTVRFDTLYKAASSGGVIEWDISVAPTPEGYGRMITRYGLRGGKKQVLEEVIKAGKNLGRANATTALQQAVAEAKARWTKQLTRRGYGKTPAASAATRSASPMLAQVFEKQRGKIDWTTAFVQPKLDGCRLLSRVDARGKLSLTSRENKPFTALDHLAATLAALPEGTTLDGELYCHDMPLNQIMSACKRRSELTAKLQYHVYDVIDPVSPFEQRAERLKGVVADLGDPAIVLVETVKVRSEVELMTCQSAFLGEGYEGAMLRHGRGGYEAGKRSASLLKYKVWQDDEYAIVDVREGRGKLAGAAIFVCETAMGHSFEVLAHGTIEEKQAHWQNWQACIGRKLTVRFQYLTKTAEPVPFLPVAIGFRDE